jgi:hypothetical protein
MGDRRRLGEHVRGIAAVPRQAGHRRFVLANELLAATAALAVAARSSEPADAGAITDSPTQNVGPDGLYGTDDFVTGHAWISKTWPLAFNNQCIAAANATGVNPNQKLPNAGRRNLAFHSF